MAAFFEKAHKHVLADIKAIVEGGSLMAEISAQWFQPTFYEASVGFGTRKWLAYDMTRDGFTLLVMGYTGPKAMEFKVRYIQQFNAMEEALRSHAPAFPDFSNPVIAAIRQDSGHIMSEGDQQLNRQKTA